MPLVILIGFALNLWIVLGSILIFAVLILLIHAHNMFPFIYIVFNFLHKCLIVLGVQVFHHLSRFITRYIIHFDVIVKNLRSL